MKLLLTGATGFLGSRTLERLIQQENITQIIACGRTLKKQNTLTHPKLSYLLGDLSNRTYVESLFKAGIDIVLHCAALSSPWGSYQSFYQANVLPQQHLIELVKAHQIQRFIYISTPSMYFNFKDRLGIKESDPLPAPVNHYARTKREAEVLLEQSGIPYISLRPRALIGRGDTVVMPRLIRAHKMGRLKIIGKGDNVVDITPVSNVVDAIISCLSVPESALNQAYNLSNGQPVPLWQMVENVLSKLGFRPPTQRIPVGIARAAAWLMETQSKLSNSDTEPVLTQYSVGVLANNFSMDIARAKALLGYKPRQSVEEAVEEFVAWYKTNPYA